MGNLALSTVNKYTGLSLFINSQQTAMSSMSLPNIFAKAKQKSSTDVATASARMSSSGSIREMMSSSLSFRNSNSSNNNNSSISRSSQRYSLKEKVASASDSVLKGLNLAALRSEEISDDSGSFEEASGRGDIHVSTRGDNKYVEVGVNELYRHKLNESIAVRRSSDAMSPNSFKDTAGHSPPEHIHDDEKVDDMFISSMAKLDNDITRPARKARPRQHRRDSLQSLASIERRLTKNRIGCTTKPRAFAKKQQKNHRRASRRDSMRSLASIEKQLIKNKLAVDLPARTGNAESIVAFRKKRASDGSNVSALGFDFPPNSSFSSADDRSFSLPK